MTDIHQDIEAQIPRLRRYARALVRDATAADDLVQECLTRALGKLHLWQDGTNLRSWLFTILHNQHVNHVRASIRAGGTVELGEAQPLRSRPADQEKRLELRDLDRALGGLTAEQRALILMVGLEGMSYDEAAKALDIAVGTVRSRLSRGRQTLRQLMDVAPDPRSACAGAQSDDSPPGRTADLRNQRPSGEQFLRIPASRPRPAAVGSAISAMPAVRHGKIPAWRQTDRFSATRSR